MSYLSNRITFGSDRELPSTFQHTSFSKLLSAQQNKENNFIGNSVRASFNRSTLCQTSYVWLYPGQQLPFGYFTADVEIFVLEGCIKVGQFHLKKHCYSFIPTGVSISSVDVITRSVLLFMTNGPDKCRFVEGESPSDSSSDLDAFIPALDAKLLPWTRAETSQFEAATKKYLRRDKNGGGIWLLNVFPHYSAPGGMIQNYNEEAVILSGNITIGDRLVGKWDHCYAPQPTAVGRHVTDDGCLCLVRVDRDLTPPGVVATFQSL